MVSQERAVVMSRLSTIYFSRSRNFWIFFRPRQCYCRALCTISKGSDWGKAIPREHGWWGQHGAHRGHVAADGPHIGPMNLAFRVDKHDCSRFECEMGLGGQSYIETAPPPTPDRCSFWPYLLLWNAVCISWFINKLYILRITTAVLRETLSANWFRSHIVSWNVLNPSRRF